jgi:hypothetical protein
MIGRGPTEQADGSFLNHSRRFAHCS